MILEYSWIFLNVKILIYCAKFKDLNYFYYWHFYDIRISIQDSFLATRQIIAWSITKNVIYSMTLECFSWHQQNINLTFIMQLIMALKKIKNISIFCQIQNFLNFVLCNFPLPPIKTQKNIGAVFFFKLHVCNTNIYLFIWTVLE